jgi:hypothetical protein
MKYTAEQRELDILRFVEETRHIRDDRGMRYCPDEDDTLGNIRMADWFESDGWRGAMAGVMECLNRIQVMAKKPTAEIDCKDFENAGKDGFNFWIFMMLLERHKRLSIPTPCEAGDCEGE